MSDTNNNYPIHFGFPSGEIVYFNSVADVFLYDDYEYAAVSTNCVDTAYAIPYIGYKRVPSR